ncbi:MAG: sigma-54-dependent Fis family transcriptional regulator [Syntrophomonadaceae bacterium]|nr:sigma-54-dependent Fis family transcriptional regulator [Syntrophomonadaceae bacterium]
MIDTMKRQELMKKVWTDFVLTHQVEEPHRIPNYILKSWERCKKLNVDPYQTSASIILGPEELQARIDQNQRLIEAASDTMMDICNFIKGSESIFGLFDKDGYALKMLGDQELINHTRKGNFREGACWNELGAGTNGVSLVLVEDRPLQIWGYEHYCRCSHYWACSAAPIHDLNGDLLGVIDLTGKRDQVHPHTLGIIVGAAKSIERMLALKPLLADYKIANKYKNVIIDLIDKSLVVIDSNDVITHVNMSAADHLGIEKSKCIGMKLKAAFPEDNASFYSMVNTQEDVINDEITIKLNNGNKIKCIVSKRNIVVDNKKAGIIITFCKSTALKKLAKKFISATKTFDDLIGCDNSFKHTIKLAKAAAAGNANILILGESGTGKDMMAQAIHNASSFSDGPFVAINCAAIPHELIASELFGYADGVFTGAVKGGKPGKLELAEGGTLFLDEIGDMPLELQTTLLRVIENKTLMRVGGDKEIPVNERIIAATNKDLLHEISLGNFRADLYYRLNIVSIEIPPLRGRPDEIKTLLDYYIDKIAREMGKPPVNLSKKNLAKLLAYDWPGNIRELHNLVARSYYFDMADMMLTDSITRVKEPAPGKISFNAHNVETFESKLIKELLEQNNYAVTEVAHKLGQSRSTLYRKMRKYNIVTKSSALK